MTSSRAPFFQSMSQADAEVFLHEVYVPSIRPRYEQLCADLAVVGAPEFGDDEESLDALWAWFMAVYVDDGRRPFEEHGLAAVSPAWTDGYLPDMEDREIRFLMVAFASILHLRLHRTHGTDIYSVNESFLRPQLGRRSGDFVTFFVEVQLIGAGRRALNRDSRRSPVEKALSRLPAKFEAQLDEFADGPPSLEPSPPEVVDADAAALAGADPLEPGQLEIMFDELTPRPQRLEFARLLREREELKGVVHDKDDLGYIIATFKVPVADVKVLVAELWERSG